MILPDDPPGLELARRLRDAERRWRWKRFLVAWPRWLFALAVAALAVAFALELGGTRVTLPARALAALTAAVGSAAIAGGHAWRQRRGEVVRGLDARVEGNGLLETADDVARRAAPMGLLSRRLLREAERRLDAQGRGPIAAASASRFGPGIAALAALTLSALLPPLGPVGSGAAGMSGTGEVANAGRRRDGGARSEKPRGDAEKTGSPSSAPSTSENAGAKPKPAGGSGEAPPPDSGAPEEIPSFTPSPKMVPIDPRGELRSKREAWVADAPAPDEFATGASAAPRRVRLDARRIEELRRAAERALASDAVDPAERAFAARYFEILAR